MDCSSEPSGLGRDNSDDSAEADQVRDAGVEVIRGYGRVTEPGRVEVDERVPQTRRVVLDTGSTPVVPGIDGLDSVPTWTSDQALSADQRPARLLIVGGGPIGCQLAQAYSAFDTEVTVIDTSDQPVSNQDPALRTAMGQVLQRSGVLLVLDGRPRKRFGTATTSCWSWRTVDGSPVTGCCW